MYKQFYGLSSDPFRLSPDSDFCLLHSTFTRAKAYMQYALHRGEGFAVVTGRPGTGKTTLIDSLLDDFSPSELDVARLVNARLEGSDLLRMVCYAFGISADGADKSDLLQRLAKHMGRSLKQKKRPLLIIDEAQGLTRSALEELRLLTNLQIDGQPLLQIFLVGQEELQDLLSDPQLEQVRQRIIGSCRLQPLKPDETIAYVVHRMKLAGWDGIPNLQSEIFPTLFRFSGGIPRLINQACSRLLLHGSLEQRDVLGEEAINLVVDELRAEHISIPVASSFIDLGDFDAEALQAAFAPLIPQKPMPGTAEELSDSLGSQPSDTPFPTTVQSETLEPFIALPPQPVELEESLALSCSGESASRSGAGTGTEDSRTDFSPLWGLAASLVLAASVLAASLLSAPRNELDRLVPDTLWGYQGIEQIRSLVSRWTDGNWPLGVSNRASESLPVPGPESLPPVASIAEVVVSYPEAMPSMEPREPLEMNEEKASETSLIPIDSAAVESPQDELAPQPQPGRPLRTPVSQIPFGFDSVEILPEHQKLLDTVASILIASRENTAHIVGYTDAIGPSVYNDFLSEQRAAAVADYIKAKGVSGEQLTVEGRNGGREIKANTAEKETVRAVKIYFEPDNALTHLVSYDPE